MIHNAYLYKIHTMLSFHRVKEVVAFDICKVYHIDGKVNPDDNVSKHWSYSKIKHSLKTLMFYRGDTIDLLE